MALTPAKLPDDPSTLKRRRGAELGARFGYAAHGLVYGLVAVFAIDAAFGSGGEQAKGGRAAISSVADSTWGAALIVALALGLIAYGLMRLWQGFANPSGHGDDLKGIGKRVGRVCSGGVQLLLAAVALDIAFGWFSAISGGGAASQGGGQDNVSSLTAQVMSWPAGRWIVGAVGVGIALASLRQLQRAVTADFMAELAVHVKQRDWVRKVGRAGFAARFVVFGVIGALLVVAAVNANPSRAEGLGGALRTLQDSSWGPWLLGLVAVGLLAFAITRGVYARYKMVPTSD